MIRAFVVAVSVASCAKPAGPPSPLPVDVASKVSAAFRLGAQVADNFETIAAMLEAMGAPGATLRTPAACAASRATAGVFLSVADGMDSSSTAPIVPGGAVDISDCGLAGDWDGEAAALIVTHAADVVKLSIDIAGVEARDPCAYAYSMAAIGFVSDVVSDGLASGGQVFQWEAYPLTGDGCEAR